MTGADATQVAVAVAIGEQDVHAGTAFIQERRGALSTTFTYTPAFQSDPRGFSISPDLPLTAGRHHVTGLPGVFADSAPDRWGRNLIAKQVRGEARLGGRPVPTVLEVDYLLGVSDLTRQGALRFRLADGPFLAADSHVPTLIELPRLLRASDAISTGDEGDALAAVKVLLDAGTGSLGGARPKASVRDGQQLLIAKFPHPGDQWDVMAWEKTVLDLAERVGIAVPRMRLVSIDGRHALLLERFDRIGAQRVHYLSAMSLVGGHDGTTYDYLEVAEALARHGATVAADLAQLWLRIAFFLAVNNTDDHLRNHGLLRARAGWSLAPAFDVNPNPDPRGEPVTSTGFSSGSRAVRRQALLACAGDFGLSPQVAKETLATVTTGVRNWRQVAASNDIRTDEQDLFTDCFEAE